MKFPRLKKPYRIRKLLPEISNLATYFYKKKLSLKK